MMSSQLSANAKAMGPVPGEEGNAGGAAAEALSPLQNRTKDSRSPFLANAANSLVAWQLLDNETIERARRENKLIYMHIGYQACHFCHLMAVDSFANRSCAQIINKSFIPVLVDREQRPDIDTIYMNYVQAVNGGGGWPLNVFVTADLEPVFGGTYFPAPGSIQPSSDHEEEVTDFMTVLQKVRDIWTEQEARCRREASDSLTQLRKFAEEGILGTKNITVAPSVGGVSAAAPTAPSTLASTTTGGETISSELDLDQLEEAYRQIAGTFDPLFGGFGLKPKFPTPSKLAYLLSLKRSPPAVQDVIGEADCDHAQRIALDTLRKIRDGAMRDHICGNGFGRFSVTPDWSIANFERLLPDNALLLALFLEAWRICGGKPDSEFYDVVVEQANYLTSSPIILPPGGFASSQAADSLTKRGDRNVREGAYYTWTSREFETTIQGADKQSLAIIAGHWGILEDGNVDQQHDPNDNFINLNILRVAKTIDDIAKQTGMNPDTVRTSIENSRGMLREKTLKDRPKPELDDKVVVGWNGLTISALARTATALRGGVDDALSDQCTTRAIKAALFIGEQMWDAQSKTLFRIWRDGSRETPAFADDYAYFIQGLLDLFALTGDQYFIKLADTLQKAQNTHFYDTSSGGFFTTTADLPLSPIRLKDGMDSSLPSINAVSVSNLFRLHSLLEDEKYSTLAHETINAFEPEMLQYPWLYPGLLRGVVTARLGAEKEGDELQVLKEYKAAREKA